IVSSSMVGFDQRHALAPPMADGGDDDLGELVVWPRVALRSLHRRTKPPVMQGEDGYRQVHRELAFEPMTDHRAGRLDRQSGVPAQERRLLGRRRLGTGCSRYDAKPFGHERGSESMPHLVEDRGYVAGTASRALAKNVRQPTERPRAASVR